MRDGGGDSGSDSDNVDYGEISFLLEVFYMSCSLDIVTSAIQTTIFNDLQGGRTLIYGNRLGA